MRATTLARLEGTIRPLVTRFPPRFVISQYSRGRHHFLKQLDQEELPAPYEPPAGWSRVLWGLRFRSPIMNAAGMFKNGECYALAAVQGAGAYLGGTGTWNPREGNVVEGVAQPFVSYPRSHAASNKLGLPNAGDGVNGRHALSLGRKEGFPLGWSVMASPDYEGEEKLGGLVKSMRAYERAGVNFLELNESCPNTGERPQDSGLTERLRYVQQHFLQDRNRKLPVVVKFSTDTDVRQVPELLDLLFTLGYDGVNFGNTSTNYEKRREHIDPRERKLFDHFISTFGGGVSGFPLQEDSLLLASSAVAYLKRGGPSQEFHVIRTGGIETIEDLRSSERSGISMNQWFTGYFQGLAQHGHQVYRRLLEGSSGR